MDTEKKSEDNKEQKDTAPANAEAKAPAVDSPKKSTDDGSEATPEAGASDKSDDKATPKPNAFKQTLKRFRVYLLIICLVVLLGGVFATVSSLNGKKTPPPPSVQSQTLTQSQLKKLATTKTTTSGQTLTIQGNAILNGQALSRGALSVAGDLQSGGGLDTPGLTISNSGSLGNAQVNGKLQVANTSTFQGVVTMQNGLNLKGNTSINTASIGTLTATNIIISGSDQIQVPSHLAFTGAFPGRTVSFGVLGNGGSASINGSDTSGTISLNTGNNPQIGCFLTVIFNLPFAHPPNILLGPIGLGAGETQHSVELITSADTGVTTAFRICSANVPPPNQAFGYSYLINGAPN